MACLDEQTVIDLVEGHLPAERRLGVIAHADLCGDCRQVIAALTRTLHPDTQSTSAPEGGPSSPLHAGSSLGRYVILDVVGSGGMGVVYSAYDPELDRRVALKLVRTPNGPDAESQRARLVREARAIARVVHPNAIVVHEVGTLDKRVFVAMEFVDGPTLSAWLRARPRSPREKLDVLIQAGRGLAAAHHAGLVHRDFKPDNVLVGADGRVRVTDFGLARAAGLAGEVAPPALPTTDVTITRSGAVVGTPAYMAPEQVLGAGADARADVFSFCVTAWECLFGARPFAGATLQALLEAVRAGRLVEGGDQTVPARIRNMLARGLSHDPQARPPTIEAVLSELSPRRSTRVLLGVALVALGIAVGTAAVTGILGARRDICGGAEHKLAGIWDGPRKEALRTSLVAGDADGWRRVERTLDEYAARWVKSHTDACQATRVRGEQSEAALEARMACLDDRKYELDALAGTLASSHELLANAITAAHKLDPIAPCDNATALRQVLVANLRPEVRERLRKRAAELRAHGRLLLPDRNGEVAAFVDEVRAANAFDLLPRALIMLGQTEFQGQRLGPSKSAFRDAMIAAALAHDDVALLSALTKLLSVVSSGAEVQEADTLARYADELLRRGGRPASEEWRLAYALSDVDLMRANWPDGTEHARRAMSAAERDPEVSVVDLGQIEQNLAVGLYKQERFDEAARLLQRSIGHFEEALGPDHPIALNVRTTAAQVESEAGHVDVAIAMERRLIATYEKIRQPRPINLAYTLNNLGWDLLQKRPAEALPILYRAITLLEEQEGPDALVVSTPLTNVGWALLALSREREAVAPLERALRLQSAPSLRESCNRAETEYVLGHALGGGARAVELVRDARDRFAGSCETRLRRLVGAADAWLAAQESSK